MAKKASELMTALTQLALIDAKSKPHGPERIKGCELAVQVAGDDVELGFQARQELVYSTLAGGRPDLTLPAFSWCVTHYDQDPDSFASLGFLVHYKFVAGTLPDFPQIERQTIESTIDDLERRFRANGELLHPVWLIRRDAYMQMGDLEKAAAAHREYKRLPRGTLSDCAACTVDTESKYDFERGRFADGLKKADKIFAGSMKCGQVPHRTHARVLLPLVKLGRAEEAMGHHRAGYPMIKDNPAFTRHVGAHIALLALTGNDGRALQLIGKHIALAIDGADPFREFHFLRLTWLALASIAGRKKRAKLRLPKANDIIAGDGEYNLADLADGVEKMALAVAERFDRRNGNDYYSRQLRETAKWQRFAVRVR